MGAKSILIRGYRICEPALQRNSDMSTDARVAAHRRAFARMVELSTRWRSQSAVAIIARKGNFGGTTMRQPRIAERIVDTLGSSARDPSTWTADVRSDCAFIHARYEALKLDIEASEAWR